MQTLLTKKWSWKKALIIFLCLILLIIIRPILFLAYVDYNDRPVEKKNVPGQVDDASNLNKTNVLEVVKTKKNTDEAILQISALIKKAEKTGKKISIAGAQHSMGGHTIYSNGIVLDMKGINYLKYDSVTETLNAGAGALWADVVPFLDRIGKSVAIMQSNNSFTVGGSVSVNCHGWTPNSPPISSTVKSFRLINAKGELIKCSKSENSELFSLVLGGYGLFGVIVDVELRVVDNQMYTVTQYLMNSSSYIKMFNQHVKNNPNVGMAYGRINVSKDNFMEEAILSVYSLDKSAKLKTLKKENEFSGLRRTVFRGSVNSDYGKKLRWKLEKGITSVINGREFSRNQLMNESVEVFQSRDANRSDILQEYFIPADRIYAFIDSLKIIMPRHKVDLLNITLRDVKKDENSFLNYAKQDMIGFVMLFNQRLNSVDESEMTRLTKKLVDISLSLNGTYYLPYRLHATKAQFIQVYPEAISFFLLKHKYDSLEVFQNEFYKTYK